MSFSAGVNKGMVDKISVVGICTFLVDVVKSVSLVAFNVVAGLTFLSSVEYMSVVVVLTVVVEELVAINGVAVVTICLVGSAVVVAMG